MKFSEMRCSLNLSRQQRALTRFSVFLLLRFCNECMIGKKVRVFWPVDESWYTGTVQKYDSSTGEHLLQYHDGDTEWVKIGENNAATAGSGTGVEGAGDMG